MRRLVASLIIALSLCSASPLGAQSARAKQGDPLFGVDKVKHFFMAGFVETLTFASLEALGTDKSPARAGAIAMTVGVSLGREIHDRRTKGLFSFRDLAWDFIGGAAAMLIINRTR